jgi:hypothetical protein
MFDSASFRKATGVDLNAGEAALVKGLTTAVSRTTSSEIATALLVRVLIVEHGWKVGESAAKVGLTATAATTAGNRGKVLWETGPESAHIVWQHVKSLSGKVLGDLATTLRTLTTDTDRTAYVTRTGLADVARKRLAENSTPEKVERMVDAMLADGHRTPVAARDAAAGIAARLGIELPVVTRPGAAGAAAGGTQADVPTFDQAMMAALAAIAQAMEGADDDQPVMLTPAQSALADQVMGALAALSDIAKVHVIA